MAELLKAENVSEVFGGLKAVSDFDFFINKGELVGLIGPNGAGKTTAFNLITAYISPLRGLLNSMARALSVSSPIRSPSGASPAPFRISGSFQSSVYWIM